MLSDDAFRHREMLLIVAIPLMIRMNRHYQWMQQHQQIILRTKMMLPKVDHNISSFFGIFFSIFLFCCNDGIPLSSSLSLSMMMMMMMMVQIIILNTRNAAVMLVCAVTYNIMKKEKEGKLIVVVPKAKRKRYFYCAQ
jgi:hypothetical protein